MMSGVETADYFRQKAAQCRRLAEGIINEKDPAVASLLALAVEFEAKGLGRLKSGSPVTGSWPRLRTTKPR